MELQLIYFGLNTAILQIKSISYTLGIVILTLQISF